MRKNLIMSLLVKTFVTFSLLVLNPIAGFSQEKIRLVYLKITPELPWFVAIERGFFKKFNLDVELIECGSSNIMFETVASGRADVSGDGAVFTFLAMEATNPGLAKIYEVPISGKDIFDGNFGREPTKLVVAKGLSISSVSELRGKRIGNFPGIYNRVILKLVLKAFNLDADKDIEIIEIAPRLHLEALKTRQIDALMSVDPTPTLCEIKGAGTIFMEDIIPKYIMDPLSSGCSIFSAKFLKEHPETAKRFMQAIKRSLDWIYKHPQEAKKILPKYIPIDEEVALKSSYSKWHLAEEEKKEIVPLLQKYIDFCVEQKLIPKRLEADKLLISEKDFK